MHGAGALLGGVEQGGNQQNQGKQHEHNDRQHEALGLLGLIGTTQVEALLEEDSTHGSADDEAQQAHKGVEVTAAHTQQHTQGAAQEHQSADHHQRAHGKAGGGRGTGLGTELLADECHDAGAQNDTDDLGTDILYHGSAVQAQSANDVTLKAGNAEAHVLGIAQSLQQQSGNTHYHARDDHEPVFFKESFHGCDFLSLFLTAFPVVFIIRSRFSSVQLSFSMKFFNYLKNL